MRLPGLCPWTQPRLHWLRNGELRNGDRRAANGPPVQSSLRLGLLGLPEDLADFLNLAQQLVRFADVHVALGPGSAGHLGGVVEQLVQLRVLREVRRLEVVRPEHPQMVLNELGPLLLNDEAAGAELWVGVVLVLLDNGFYGLGLDARLRGVVDAARKVTVRMRGNLRREETCEQPH